MSTRSCKKTHKRVSGTCVPNNVVNKTLYARIKKRISKRVKRKGQRWGAYTSGNLVQAYKRAGGKYRGRKKTFARRKKSKKRRRSKSKSKRKRRSKSRRRKSRRRKNRMRPPGYEENFPPPYSSASQIEEYLTTIAALQNKVTRLEDLLERTQQSCDKRISDLNIYNQQLEATVFYYQNSGGGRLPGLQLSPQDIAEMNAEAGSDLDRETSSDSDEPPSPPPSPRYDPYSPPRYDS